MWLLSAFNRSLYSIFTENRNTIKNKIFPKLSLKKHQID